MKSLELKLTEHYRVLHKAVRYFVAQHEQDCLTQARAAYYGGGIGIEYIRRHIRFIANTMKPLHVAVSELRDRLNKHAKKKHYPGISMWVFESALIPRTVALQPNNPNRAYLLQAIKSFASRYIQHVATIKKNQKYFEKMTSTERDLFTKAAIAADALCAITPFLQEKIPSKTDALLPEHAIEMTERQRV